MAAKTATADPLSAFADGAVHLVTTVFTTNPVLMVAVVAFIVLLSVARSAARGRGAPVDPARLFSAAQRTEGFARAGGRCELDAWLFTRCRKPATHGDHHFPHSKGGATSLGNFAAACARHNMSKGAKVPTFFATQRMEFRRRRYFPKGTPVTVGERFGRR